MSADEKAIRELIDRWTRASAAGDLDAVLAMMADDVIFTVMGQEPFGKDTFAKNSRAMEGVRVEGVSNPVEIKVLGDWAWLRNHIDLTITPKAGGAPIKRSGYTLTILTRKTDGNWVISRDANLVGPPKDSN
ncbi:MAG: SgcJ/EcaC family oxidoreductase [Gammaproteobacteria bacterium]